MTERNCSGRLQLRFDSDWHVGDGAGQHGLIDRIIRRDPANGLPFIPAKTLVGIWRDACERVAFGLDNATPGDWSAWVEVLFGDEPARREARGQSPEDPPRSALLSVRPAYLADGLPGLLAVSSQLRAALTFVKPGVAIDPRTGQAKTDFLRFEEVVRTGAELEALVKVTDCGSPQGNRAALALLWAGARTIERLGGKRRRGIGRCTWAFPLIDEAEALVRLKQDPSDPPSRSASATYRQFEPLPSAKRSTSRATWFRLPLLIQPRTPLVIPKEVVGNLVESHDFVPGTHLLGPVTQRIRRLGIDPFPWVASGALRVCHGYPVLDGEDQERGRPVPMAIAFDKEHGGLGKEGGRVCNRLREGIGEGGAQWKPHRDGYVGSYRNALPRFTKPGMMMATHATVDDESQRPIEDVVGVYSYQAIHPGTLLCSEVWVSADLHERLGAVRTDWWQDLAGEARLGRARKDDYGQVELAPQALESVAEPDAGRGSVASFTVWLLSDLLLRDELLQPATTLEALCGALKRELPEGSVLQPLKIERVVSPICYVPGAPTAGIRAGGCRGHRTSGLRPALVP